MISLSTKFPSLKEFKYKFFGCGKIYIQNDKRPKHSLCYRFEVFNRKELFEKIIPFFEENPPKISSRKRDFQIFREIAYLIKENQDLEKIKLLKSKMHWKN